MANLLKIIAWKITWFFINCRPPAFVSVSNWFPYLRKPFTKAFRNAEAREFDPDSGLIQLMNYGYASQDPSDFQIQLDERDKQEFRFSWRLVYETVRSGHLADKDVLVVGCGRGGDAYFVKRYMRAKTVIGIDLSESGIALCKRNYEGINGLIFQVGDAEHLTFRNQQFNAVVNIESSHHYPSLRQFYREVYRVLKPGGVFLYADYFWDKNHKRYLEEAGFRVLEEKDITQNIVLAAEEGYEMRKELLRKVVPEYFLNEALELSGAKGTHTYWRFKKGKLPYKRFVLVRGTEEE